MNAVHDAAPAYGLWSLVILNSLIFIIFAFSFTKPQSARDWRSFGAFSGFLLEWPTLVTLIMFPILLVVYARLAKREELDMVAEFGREYEAYRQYTPAFIPSFGRKGASVSSR